MTWHWTPSPDFDAQMAHVGWGAFIVLAISLGYGLVMAWCLLVIYVIAKEFVFDLVIETGETVWTSGFDALFYLIGGCLGSATALALKWWCCA